METAASLLLIFSIYFLGCLALVQEIIKPSRHFAIQGTNKVNQISNHAKILSLSGGISLVTTFLAYFLFLS